MVGPVLSRRDVLTVETISRARLRAGLCALLFAVVVCGWASARADAHVYWANINSGSIGRAELDGSRVNQSFIIGATSPT